MAARRTRMIARTFGSTGRAVSRIGQGTWQVPERGQAAKEAKRALLAGIELGMTHIDTAEMYGDGRAEELIGEAIREGKIDRERLFIVSKVLPSNSSYAGTLRACERSLKRLGIEYLDCYLLHWRGSQPLSETMRALEKLVDDGKTKSLGVSNFDLEDLKEAALVLERHSMVCNQVLYNLKERGVEHRVLPWCAENGVAVTAYTPFGRGLPSADSAQGRTLAEIARKHAVGTHAIVLAFLTRDEQVFTIPKAATVEHVEENAAAGNVKLDDDDISQIERVFPRTRSKELRMI